MPWLIWGTLAYLIAFVLKATNMSIGNYLSYLCGVGTWLYYVPMYLIINVIFTKWNNCAFLYSSIAITLFFLTLAAFVKNNTLISLPSYYLFLNPFNWFGFYAIGILMQKNKTIFEIKTVYILIVSLFLVLIPAIYLFYSDHDVNYWNPVSMIFECGMFYLIFALSTKVGFLMFFKEMGKQSYVLYFLHMQFGISVTNKLLNNITLCDSILLFLKPIFVACATLVLIEILRYILYLLRLDNYFKILGIVK